MPKEVVPADMIWHGVRKVCADARRHLDSVKFIRHVFP